MLLINYAILAITSTLFYRAMKYLTNDENTFAKRFTSTSGINSLMDDMAKNMPSTTSHNVYMLGGGNPGYIPQVIERLTELMQKATYETVKQMWGTYSEPRGDIQFRTALAALLQKHYNWQITSDNIALTNGSQSAFFSLFNLFAGDKGKILLPLSPEYIGYTQLGLRNDMIISIPAKTRDIAHNEFIYTPDFETLQTLDWKNIHAACVSCPCNPSGKVLHNQELTKLHALCQTMNIPLIIDNAYGNPFPGIIFNKHQLPFGEHIVLVCSLSKLGLPAARTGIVIANTDIINQIGKCNAATALAPSSSASTFITPLITSGEILSLCDNAIRPFYQQRGEHAIQKLKNSLAGYPCRIHSLEGGIFIWLWMQDFPISDELLYNRLKKRGVIVVPGKYFYPEKTIQSTTTLHQKPHTCIRLSYAGNPQHTAKGLAIVASEIKQVYESI